MLKDIIDNIIERLSENHVSPVYSAFDGRALERKGRGFFTVVGISSFESSTPIYSQYMVYLPFRSEIELNVTAPESSSMEELYEYYDNNIAPVMLDMSGMTCSLSSMSIRSDSNIGRLVLTVKLRVSGITKYERSAP
ncbi:MAG: hypothetical protein J6X85_00055 [Ruminococcus sp.]|nr:hypothetical protein [Ruminococcus sp.]